MRIRRRPALLCAAVLLSSLSLPSASMAQVTAEDPAMQQRVLEQLAVQVMQPMTEDFATAGARLASASREFCSGKARLAEVQTAWRNTQSAWQALEMMPIGPVSESRLHRHINAWPVRVRLMKPLLEDDAGASVEKVRRMGAAAKGLPAVEYLLYEESESLSQAHCGALNALTGHIGHQAKALAMAWKEPEGGFARQLANAGRPGLGDTFASTDQAMSDIVNLLIAGLDTIKIRKLGRAMEKSTDEPALARIESWRSGTSLANIAANLHAFDLVFFGKGEDGVGLDDYLASIDRPGLGRAIARQVGVTQEALADVRPPLYTAVIEQPEAVAALHKEIAWLQYLMETEVAGALNVDLGFNANDGD